MTAAKCEVFCDDDGGNFCRTGLVLTCDWDWTQQLVVRLVTIRAKDHGMIAVIAASLMTTARSTKDAQLT